MPGPHDKFGWARTDDRGSLQGAVRLMCFAFGLSFVVGAAWGSFLTWLAMK